MKKGKRLFRAVSILALLLLLTGIAGAGIRFYPAWKAAKLLGKGQGTVNFSYELELELNKEELESGQVKVLEILAYLTGFPQEAMFHFDIRGSVWEDKIHALFYPQGAGEPLIELYLSDDTDVINEAMLYNAIRSHLLKDNAVLSFLVPVQEKEVFMSLEQVEQIFGIDLDRAKSFEVPFGNQLTEKQYFFMLAAMAHKKTENGESFELSAEGIRIRYELSNEDSPYPASIQYDIKEPAKVLGEAELLSKAGINLSDERLRALKSISIRMILGEEQEVLMPTEFVNQDIIDLITKIRELFMSLENKGDGQGAL